MNEDMPMYNAFVLYAPEDINFVKLLRENMEDRFGLKVHFQHLRNFKINWSKSFVQLFLKDRDDLLAGLPFEFQAVTEFISNHCRFVLPIFSPRFLDFEDNSYFVSFAEALAISNLLIFRVVIYHFCT